LKEILFFDITSFSLSFIAAWPSPVYTEIGFNLSDDF